MPIINRDEITREIERSSLASILVVANVGYYVYKNFKENPTVLSIARKYDSESIVRVLNEVINQDEITFVDRLVIYSLLTALSFKTDAIAYNYFKSPDGGKIRWWSDFRELYFMHFKSTNTLNFNLNYHNNNFHHTKSSQ